jgi:hypothetical protein
MAKELGKMDPVTSGERVARFGGAAEKWPRRLFIKNTGFAKSKDEV